MIFYYNIASVNLRNKIQNKYQKKMNNNYLKAEKRLIKAFRAISKDILDWTDDVEFNKRNDKTLLTNSENIVIDLIVSNLLDKFPEVKSIIN